MPLQQSTELRVVGGRVRKTQVLRLRAASIVSTAELAEAVEENEARMTDSGPNVGARIGAHLIKRNLKVTG